MEKSAKKFSSPEQLRGGHNKMSNPGQKKLTFTIETYGWQMDAV